MASCYRRDFLCITVWLPLKTLPGVCMTASFLMSKINSDCFSSASVLPRLLRTHHSNYHRLVTHKHGLVYKLSATTRPTVVATGDYGQEVHVCCVRYTHHKTAKNLNPNFILNPHLPNGLSHPYQLDESIFHLRGVWCTFFIFIIFLIQIPESKQCRPWSDAAFYGIWFGSALFAYVPKMGRQAYMG